MLGDGHDLQLLLRDLGLRLFLRAGWRATLYGSNEPECVAREDLRDCRNYGAVAHDMVVDLEQRHGQQFLVLRNLRKHENISSGHRQLHSRMQMVLYLTRLQLDALLGRAHPFRCAYTEETLFREVHQEETPPLLWPLNVCRAVRVQKILKVGSAHESGGCSNA